MRNIFLTFCPFFPLSGVFCCAILPYKEKKGATNLATVYDVARYILEQKGEMSSLKLQKLCYYCQAWHYTWTHKPLFDEKIEAWKNGPVCPALYANHAHQYTVKPQDIWGHPELLTDDERDSVDVVVSAYGDMQPYELREQTHQEDPWIDARKGIREDDNSHNEITLEAMGKYYAER